MGLNLFAYCLNNPINFSDYSGESADSYAGWVGEMIGRALYEWITGEDHPGRTEETLANEVRQTQINAAVAGANALWDAYVHSNELAVQQQYRRDMQIKDLFETEIERWRTDPALAGDFAALSASAVSSYITYAAIAAGVSIPVAGQVVLFGVGAVCVVWAGLRYYEVV